MSFLAHVDDAIDQQFKKAEAQHMCLAPTSKQILRALMRRLEEGSVLRPHKGLYARTQYWEKIDKHERMRHIIRAISTKHPTWTFSHSSAALLHDLEVSNMILWPINYTVAKTCSARKTHQMLPHRRRHVVPLPINGARATSLEQTVIDCATSYSFAYGLSIADSALHLGLTSKERLASCLGSLKKLRNKSMAKRVIEHADSRCDNGGESYIRALMIENNLPTPELQVPVPNIYEPGHFYYVDFMFTRDDGVRVAMELDGADKYQNAAMTKGRKTADIIRAERQREAAITSQNIQVVRFGFRQACNQEFLLNTLAKYGIRPMQ